MELSIISDSLFHLHEGASPLSFSFILSLLANMRVGLYCLTVEKELAYYIRTQVLRKIEALEQQPTGFRRQMMITAKIFSQESKFPLSGGLYYKPTTNAI